MIDSQHLRSGQYKTSQNLSARIRLHEQYSTAQQDFMRWLFDALLRHAPTQAHILELGCGRGDIWHKNADRIGAGWQVTLTDFSPGMLADCRTRLDANGTRFSYDVVDAQNIPFPAHCFDVVMANYMLYHVPNRPGALREIHRVLKPGGVLLAATIGENHMRELMELAERFIPPLAAERDRHGFITGNFSLENGAGQLETYFASVDVQRFPDSLRVTGTQPLMDYVESMNSLPGEAIMGANGAALRAEIDRRITADGAITITKDAGLFVATKPGA